MVDSNTGLRLLEVPDEVEAARPDDDAAEHVPERVGRGQERRDEAPDRRRQAQDDHVLEEARIQVQHRRTGALPLARDPPPAAARQVALAEEVRLMMRTGQPIVLLHENDMEDGGCEFGRFFSTTPQELIAGGLYKALALAYCPGPFRQVSLTLCAKKLGAVSKVTLALALALALTLGEP